MISTLFESIKLQTDPNEIQKTKSLINNLLAQAEQCKAQLHPVRHIPDPIIYVLRPQPAEINIPSVPENPINSTTSAKKPQQNANKIDEDSLEAMIESEILDVSRSME